MPLDLLGKTYISNIVYNNSCVKKYLYNQVGSGVIIIIVICVGSILLQYVQVNLHYIFILIQITIFVLLFKEKTILLCHTVDLKGRK